MKNHRLHLPLTRLVVAGLCLVGWLGAGCGSSDRTATQDPSMEGPFATARLVADPYGLRPGETTHIGIRFEIAPGWHLYWNGQNDSGLPPTATITLPEGYTAGDLAWPAPHRKISPGGILDHVYQDQVTLLLPVTAPANARPGAPVDLTVALDWLVCREACVAESDTVQLELFVADGRPQPRSRDEATRILTAARNRLPRPAPANLARWEGSTLILRVQGANEMAYYPSTDAPQTVSLLEDGAAEGDRLNIRFVPEDLDRPVTGVVEIHHPDHHPGIYEIRVPPPAESARG